MKEDDKLFYWDCETVEDKTWESLCYQHSKYLNPRQKKVLGEVLGL